MAVFSKDDPRSLGHEIRDEIVEKVMESYGFTFFYNPLPDEKTFHLQNNYQVNSWNRHKNGFIGTYKGFSIMEMKYDGWNAKRSYRYHNEITKLYHPYISLLSGIYIVFTKLSDTGLTQEELQAFAAGDKTHAKEESLATQILNSIREEKIIYLKKRRKEIEELRKIHGSEYVRKMDAEIDIEEFAYGLL